MFRDFIILLDSSHDSWGNDGLFVKIAAIVLDVWLHTSSGSRPRCSFCIPEPKVKNVFWDFMILVDSSHDFWENDTLFEKIAAMVLDIWLDTSSGHKWPRCSFWVPDPKLKKFFEISWFYWIYLMILEKMMVCLWKLQLWFWTYGLIRLLCPSGPDVVAGSQTSRSRNILRFPKFIGFISWFLRKWWPVWENCSYGSGHMAWYVFWAKVTQM